MQHLPVTTNAILHGFRVVRFIDVVRYINVSYGGWRQRHITAADRAKVAMQARTGLEQVARERYANAVLRYRLRELVFPGGIAVAIASGHLVIVQRLKQ